MGASDTDRLQRLDDRVTQCLGDMQVGTYMPCCTTLAAFGQSVPVHNGSLPIDRPNLLWPGRAPHTVRVTLLLYVSLAGDTTGHGPAATALHC
jgi:hypothetical protein